MPGRSSLLFPAWMLLVFLVLAGCSHSVPSPTLAGNWVEERSLTGETAKIAAVMDSVRSYESERLESIDRSPRGWEECAFYVGVVEAYRATGRQTYWDALLAWAERNDWQLGPRKQNADDQCVGQVYLDLIRIAGATPSPRRVEPTQKAFDETLTRYDDGAQLWWWADALFMAPAGLVRLTSVTGSATYATRTTDLFWESADALFDAEAGLYYRDEKYVGRRNENGKKVFWSRGNGWVLAGLVRILAALPEDHPGRDRFVDHFQRMAAAVAERQQPSGYWRPSLQDPDAYPTPETSGTGFFCYALAWGIQNGILDARRYAPVVERAWTALVDAVRNDGRLQWVQPVGEAPAAVEETDTAPYGAGAFLLAGSAVLDLAEAGQIFGVERSDP